MKLDKTAEQIFRRLIEGLKVGKAKKVGEDDGPFMQVHVDRLSQTDYSIAHYFTQNGDLCCDPDMVFRVTGDGVTVVSFQQAIPPIYQHVDSCSAEQIKSMTEFACMWMRNIADQQGIELSEDV